MAMFWHAKIRRSLLIGVGLLLSSLISAFGQRNGEQNQQQVHQHTDGDLDFVQCHHAFYRVDQKGFKPELVSGQESRSNPSRQYLPPATPPAVSPSEVAPAASFDQPSVEKALVSPSLQKSYNSLFGQTNRPELAPAAAQNVPANALAPAAPKTANKITSDDDDPKYSLDRLCKDAFHSFLCKPITGPRRTPNGRLRPNAVIPPDVLAGLSSSQDVSRIRPDNSIKSPPPPLQPFPSNKNNQRVAFPTTPTTPKPTSRPPAPFSKPFTPYKPDLPSPTNLNPQVLRPEPPNEVPFQSAPQTNGYFYEKPSVPFPSQEPNPSNQNQQFIPTTKPPATRPTQGYTYDRPRVPFPSNNIPQVAQPPQAPHDCNQNKNVVQPVIANPSNESPAFENPKTKSFYTQKNYTFTFSTPNIPRYTQPPTTSSPFKPHDCSSHRFSLSPFTNPTTKSYYAKPTTTPRPPFEVPKVPSSTFNVPQIVAQPQQLNAVKVPPKQQGYVYEKPPIPFPSPVGNPSNNNPFVSKPTQRPFTFPTTSNPSSGYSYDQPRIPFPSNNIAQIISSRPQQQQTVTTTVATPTPCHHSNNEFPPVQSSTNQNSAVVRPDQPSNGYVYDKPKVPFPPEVVNPSNQDPVRLRPSVTTTRPTTGYFYDKPANPLQLPNQNINVQNSIEPNNNGLDYYKGKPSVQNQNGFSSNSNGVFQISVNSGSTQPPPPFEAITTSGYSYNKPKGPYPSSINEKLSEPSEEKLSFLPKPRTPVVGLSSSQQANNPHSQFKIYGR